MDRAKKKCLSEEDLLDIYPDGLVSTPDNIIDMMLQDDNDDIEPIVVNVVSSENLSVNDIIQYIANFESYISRLKEIHWSCNEDKIHVLTDDLIHKFTEYQDGLAEDYMGYCGAKLQIGTLSLCCDCSMDASTLPELLNLLREDTNLMISFIKGLRDNKLSGIEHRLNSIMDTINVYLYKETQK